MWWLNSYDKFHGNVTFLSEVVLINGPGTMGLMSCFNNIVIIWLKGRLSIHWVQLAVDGM